jgi:hypothetical protein
MESSSAFQLPQVLLKDLNRSGYPLFLQHFLLSLTGRTNFHSVNVTDHQQVTVKLTDVRVAPGQPLSADCLATFGCPLFSTD